MIRSCRALLAACFFLCAGTNALAQTAAFTATITAESADLVDKSASNASVVDHVFKGTRLPAFGLSPDRQWVRVKGPAGTAWVARSLVAVTKGAPAPLSDEPVKTAADKGTKPPKGKEKEKEPKTASSSLSTSVNGAKRYAYVAVKRTNVLLNANDASPTVSVASRNDVFEVGGLSRDKMYVKVRYDDGRVGFIAKNDLKPGKPETAVAKADSSPRPKATPEEEVRPPKDDPPPRPRRARTAQASDTRIWADGGTILFHEKVTSNEGYGYNLSGNGFGAGVRYEHRIAGGFLVEAGYLGTANQRLPAPGTSTSVFSTTHRIDVSAKYKLDLGSREDPANLFVLAGFQNYTFYVQPQSLDFFYSQVYNGLAFGAGGEVPLGNFHLGADVRLLAPTLAAERYGSGAKGADGQSSSTNGLSYGAGVRYAFYSGASLGLNFRNHTYTTKWSGTGLRGVNEGGTTVAKKITGVKVVDQFQAITIEFARGF